MKKKIITILLVIVAVILVIGLVINHKQKTILHDETALINAAAQAADTTIENAGQPWTIKGNISETCLAQQYPETFDLRRIDTDGDGVFENYVTSVKQQTPFGTCWAFSAMAAAETSILFDTHQDAVVQDADGTLRDAIDLSEHHTTWFAYAPMPEEDKQAGEGLYSQVDGVEENISLRLSSGLTPFGAASLFASGIGPVPEPDYNTAVPPESQLNYRGKNGIVKNDERRKCDVYSEKDDWSIDESQRFRQSYILEDIYYLPTSVFFDSSGTYDFAYADKVVQSYKEQLMNGRAISLAFRSDSHTSEETARFISNDTWAHFTYEPKRANHSVTIIGWDDNYSRSNFLSEIPETDDDGEPMYTADGQPIMKPVNRPEKDGAWIVKNSFGALDSIAGGLVENNWGIDGSGYFYLSYYDQSIETAQCFDFDVTNRLNLDPENYVLEAYDFMPCENPHSIRTTFPVSEANVFTAKENESLQAVSCVSSSCNEEITFNIYNLNEGTNKMSPKKQELLSTFTETFPNPGLHVIPLPEPLPVEKGQRIAVCLTQKSGDDYLISVGAEFNQKGHDAEFCDDNYAAKAVVNPGESYIYLNESNTWQDFSVLKEKLENTDGSTSYFTYDNFPIKIYANVLE